MSESDGTGSEPPKESFFQFLRRGGEIVDVRSGAELHDSIREELERAHDQHTPDSESKDKSDKSGTAHSGVDGAVLAVSELLFLLFGLPFGDDLYHDRPIPALHWFYLAIAVTCAIGGPMWPTMRNRWASPRVAASVANAARDARVWIAVLLIFFLYGVAPDIYRRAIVPVATKPGTGFTQQQVNEKISVAVTNLNSQLTEANRQRDAARRDAEAFRQQIQNAPPQPPAPEDEVPVNWQPDFQLNWYGGPKIAWIRFLGVSSALAHIKDAYVISTLTGHREPLDLANPTNLGERWKIDQVEPVPSGATVILVYEPKPPPALPDFMSQWGAFEFHVVYDNKEYVKIYSQNYINAKMGREMPGVFGPRVTPRNDK
jgi:hypothetical protein